MFSNLRSYFVKNLENKTKEIGDKDIDLWEQLENNDIIDLAFSRAEKIEILCIILLCISAFLLCFGFLTYFHIIDIEKLVQTLRQCAL